MIVPAPRQMMMSENTEALRVPGLTCLRTSLTGEEARCTNFCTGDLGCLLDPGEILKVDEPLPELLSIFDYTTRV